MSGKLLIERKSIERHGAGHGAYNAFESMIGQYSPLYRALMRNNFQYDADDLKQEIFLRFLQRFENAYDWETVDNKRAYIVNAARNMAAKMWAQSRTHHYSIGNEENLEIHNSLSDEGNSYSQMNQDIEYESYREQIKGIINSEFSEYEQTLIQLNFIEGCKPAQIAEILMHEYSELLDKEFPGMVTEKNSRNLRRLQKFIQVDCNRVNARFRQKLKISLSTGI